MRVRAPSLLARLTAASVFSYVRLYTETGKPFSATLSARFCARRAAEHGARRSALTSAADRAPHLAHNRQTDQANLGPGHLGRAGPARPGSLVKSTVQACQGLQIARGLHQGRTLPPSARPPRTPCSPAAGPSECCGTAGCCAGRRAGWLALVLPALHEARIWRAASKRGTAGKWPAGFPASCEAPGLTWGRATVEPVVQQQHRLG